VDIKTITGAVGLVITLGGLLIFQGKLIERVEILEKQTAPNIKPLEQDIAINKAEIKVLKTIIDEMKARSDNPLAQ